LLMPAGAHGPSFLTTRSFVALKAYNVSELYALFVGHLGDRIAGGAPFRQPWHKITQLSGRDVVAVQASLPMAGLYTDRIDGKAGPRTRTAIGTWQKQQGTRQDCWPTADVLRRMQASRAAGTQ